MKISMMKDKVEFEMDLDEFKLLNSIINKVEYKSDDPFDHDEKAFSKKYRFLPIHKVNVS